MRKIIIATLLALGLMAPGAFGQTQTATITLGWTDNSNLATNSETKWEMERCPGAGCTSGFVKVGEPAANATSFVDVIPNDPGNATYGWRIRGVNAAGNGPYSAIAYGTTSAIIVVPPAPTGLTVKNITISSVDLEWRNESTATATNELEYRRQSRPYGDLASLGGDQSFVRVTGLRSNTSYNFRLQRCAGAGCSDWVTTPAVKTLK